MRKRVPRLSSVMGGLKPKLVEAVLELLVKIVGETLKDKVARAVLVGLLSSVGHYVASDSTPAPAPTMQVTQPVEMNKAP